MDFETLWRANYSALWHAAHTSALSREDTEDLLSNTALKAFQSFNSYDRETPFYLWAYKILDLTQYEMLTQRVCEPETMSFSDVTAADVRCELRR